MTKTTTASPTWTTGYAPTPSLKVYTHTIRVKNPQYGAWYKMPQIVRVYTPQGKD